MTDEPPPDFREFVAARRDLLRLEATRLTGGDAQAAGALEMEVLTDLAGHWRRLTWLSRLRHHDTRAEYLHRRLVARTHQWREDQPYPVEVLTPSPPAPFTRPAPHRPAASVALRLADLLPATARTSAGAVADAEIAWAHAYRRFTRRRWIRICLGIVLLLYYMVHFMERASAGAF